MKKSTKNLFDHGITRAITRILSKHSRLQFQKRKKKPSQPLDSLQTQNAKKSRAKGRKIKEEKKEGKKGKKGEQSKGAVVELLLGVARAENLSACEEISRAPLSSLQVLASVPKLSSVGVQLFDRTRDTTKHILTRNSPLFISMAD